VIPRILILIGVVESQESVIVFMREDFFDVFGTTTEEPPRPIRLPHNGRLETATGFEVSPFEVL